MVEWSRALDLKSGGPWSNSPLYCYLDLFSVVPSSTPRPRCVHLTKWSASHQLGFLTVYVIFTCLGIYLQ